MTWLVLGGLALIGDYKMLIGQFNMTELGARKYERTSK